MVLCLINHLNFRSPQSSYHPFPVAQTGQRSVFVTAYSFCFEDQRRSCSGFKLGSLPSTFIGFIDTGGVVTVLVLSVLQDKYQGT